METVHQLAYENIRKVTLRCPKGTEPRTLDAEWYEYNLPAVRAHNGYWVAIAFVVIQSRNQVVLGASACSPSDYLDKAKGANIAIGRARQVAGWFLTDVRAWRANRTLFGAADSCLRSTTNEMDTEALVEQVAMTAERQGLFKDLDDLRRKHPFWSLKMDYLPLAKARVTAMDTK